MVPAEPRSTRAVCGLLGVPVRVEGKNPFQARAAPALENSIKSSCVKEVFQSLVI